MSMTDTKKDWHDVYPKPRSTTAQVTHDILREMIEESAGDEDTGFVVVDVRRNDFEGHSIINAVNIPAQSFPLALPTWSKVFGDRTVIFHCQSSNGRGPRCASWYQDCMEIELRRSLRSLTWLDLDEYRLPGDAAVLVGGIKEWVKQYGDDPKLVTKIPALN